MGQGKSSVIAELVHKYGPEKTAYHFIPFNPGPDYQVSLLRDVMARLILTHNLSDDSRKRIASRSALRRLPETDDVARMVEYLLGEGGRNVTGTVFTVDAGNSA